MLNKTNRGGKRMRAGRKPQGITKKVSLTLTAQIWEEINQFDGTFADYIRSLRGTKVELSHFIQTSDNSTVNQCSLETPQTLHNELTHKRVQELWEIYLQDFLVEQTPGDNVTEQAITNAHISLFGGLFKDDCPKVETSLRYRSPFTGKWFSQVDNMLKKEVPTLLSWAQSKIDRQKEIAARNNGK
jgi:hypothetical protein